MAADDLKRAWFSQGPASHRAKKATRELSEGEEAFTIADVEALGFNGVKKFAAERGFLKEGRYTIAGRAKVKRMSYVDREGLVEVLKYFRARQGATFLVEVERDLAKLGRAKERELKKVRSLQLLPEKV